MNEIDELITEICTMLEDQQGYEDLKLVGLQLQKTLNLAKQQNCDAVTLASLSALTSIYSRLCSQVVGQSNQRCEMLRQQLEDNGVTPCV